MRQEVGEQILEVRSCSTEVTDPFLSISNLFLYYNSAFADAHGTTLFHVCLHFHAYDSSGPVAGVFPKGRTRVWRAGASWIKILSL